MQTLFYELVASIALRTYGYSSACLSFSDSSQPYRGSSAEALLSFGPMHLSGETPLTANVFLTTKCLFCTQTKTTMCHFTFWISLFAQRNSYVCTHKPRGVIIVGIFMSSNIHYLLLSASLYVSKRGAYWDRLCRDVIGCHARALWPNGAS